MEGADQVISSLETLILLLTFSDENKPVELRLALKCAVRLCESRQEYCETFVELLGTRLDNVNSEQIGPNLWLKLLNSIFPGDYTIIICETLGAIGGLKGDTLLPLVNDILSLLHALADIKKPTKQQTHTKTMLCNLIFQTLSGYTWNEQTEETIKKVKGFGKRLESFVYSLFVSIQSSLPDLFTIGI